MVRKPCANNGLLLACQGDRVSICRKRQRRDKIRRRWNASSEMKLRRPASASGCAENASVAVSRRAEDSPGLCTNMRKRPSANIETNLRRPASASGVVVQRAETRAGLDNSSTESADKIMEELLRCEYNMRIFSLTREAGELSTAQIAEIEALKIQQKYLADEIFWNGIFREQ